MKHDLSYYEHFLDDERRPGRIRRASKVRRALRMASIFREFLATPDALREVVFGSDDLTMKADVLDAAGFSAADPETRLHRQLVEIRDAAVDPRVVVRAEGRPRVRKPREAEEGENAKPRG